MDATGYAYADCANDYKFFHSNLLFFMNEKNRNETKRLEVSDYCVNSGGILYISTPSNQWLELQIFRTINVMARCVHIGSLNPAAGIPGNSLILSI